MEFLNQIIKNQILMAGVIGRLAAQTVKTFFYAIVNKKFDLRRFFGDTRTYRCLRAL